MMRNPTHDNPGNMTARTRGAFSATYAYAFGLTRLTSIYSADNHFTYDGAGNRLKAIGDGVQKQRGWSDVDSRRAGMEVNYEHYEKIWFTYPIWRCP